MQPIEDFLHLDKDVEVIPNGTAFEREYVNRPTSVLDISNKKLALAANCYLFQQLLGVVVVNRHETIVETNKQRLKLVAEIRRRLLEGVFRQ